MTILGIIFNIIIIFYMCRTSPLIKILTRIEHPCVHNGVLQLDILNELDKTNKNFTPPSGSLSKYRYWYPGYSTLCILIQLEGTVCMNKYYLII